MSRRGGVSRREVLKRAGVAGTAILALPDLGRVLPGTTDVVAQTRTLTAEAFATLHAVCARLIPTDENGPGATEAHAAEYIDRALGGALAAARSDYKLGLTAIDRAAQQTFGAVFAKLAPPQQDAVLRELFGRKRVRFLGPQDIPGNLTVIKDLLERGRFKPVIDRQYPIEQISEAFAYVATGQKIGNVIVTMD